jgi:hypothetical protein
LNKPFDVLVDLDYRLNWLGIVDEVQTRIISLDRDIFIPELSF